MILLTLTSPDDMLWRFSVVILLCAILQVLHDIHMSLRHCEHFAAVGLVHPAPAPKPSCVKQVKDKTAETVAEKVKSEQ